MIESTVVHSSRYDSSSSPKKKMWKTRYQKSQFLQNLTIGKHCQFDNIITIITITHKKMQPLEAIPTPIIISSGWNFSYSFSPQKRCGRSDFLLTDTRKKEEEEEERRVDSNQFMLATNFTFCIYSIDHCHDREKPDTKILSIARIKEKRGEKMAVLHAAVVTFFELAK